MVNVANPRSREKQELRSAHSSSLIRRRQGGRNYVFLPEVCPTGKLLATCTYSTVLQQKNNVLYNDLLTARNWQTLPCPIQHAARHIYRL